MSEKEGTVREIWDAYQTGQGSADRTCYEVFVEVVQPLLGRIQRLRIRGATARNEAKEWKDLAERLQDLLTVARAERDELRSTFDLRWNKTIRELTDKLAACGGTREAFGRHRANVKRLESRVATLQTALDYIRGMCDEVMPPL